MKKTNEASDNIRGGVQFRETIRGPLFSDQFCVLNTKIILIFAKIQNQLGSWGCCPQIGSKGVKKGQNLISHEPLVVETQQTPHFNEKHHVSISDSYNIYLSDDRKCPQMPKYGKKGPKGTKTYISRTVGRRDWVDPTF